ncbi:MAG: MATE family efflux transporter, partial [Clostridia bacterium]|nr:MATE family efflux transporter [Clostridia bacterium]
SLGITMFSVIIGHLGSVLVAAYSITKVARNLGSVICFGISSACAIMVGKELGAGRLAGVERMTRRLLLVTAVTAVFGGIVVIFARPIILQMGELTDQARTYLGIMLWVVSYYILGQALNTTWICGIFRPGGDATFGVILDILVLWVVTIPLTAVCAFVIKLPVMVVYFIICLDEFIKMPFVVIRYHKKKWIRNITRDLADK